MPDTFCGLNAEDIGLFNPGFPRVSGFVGFDWLLAIRSRDLDCGDDGNFTRTTATATTQLSSIVIPLGNASLNHSMRQALKGNVGALQ